MTQVSAALQRRPFHYPELWAGRIARIQAAHPRDMGLEDLARESGLTIAQLEQAALWAGRAAVPRVASHALPSTGHTDGSGHTDDSTAVDGW
ncbi:hypothetical protein [Streptomyces sp. NPDC089799]|uniref:hypothetical protein n=1 Tax=Streptomyces sp. NPDC089799 TaxID=3155066 RepID=UPI0034148571